MKKALKIGVLVMVLVYISGLGYTYYSNNKFDQQFEFYDSDKNGVIDGDEITRESKLFLNQTASRKTTNQAVIILIPIAVFFGIVSFGMTILFSKMKNINDNEIHYGQ